MNEQNCDLVPKKIVTHNNIYEIDLGKLNSKENDLLFAIFSFLKNIKETLLSGSH